MDEFVSLSGAAAILVARQRTDDADDRFLRRRLRDVLHLCAHREDARRHDVDPYACHRHVDLFCAIAG